MAEEIQNHPQVDSPTTDISVERILSPKELLRVAHGVTRAFSEDPDFNTKFRRELRQAESFVRAIKIDKEIREYDSAYIIAALRTELLMAMEIDPLTDVKNRNAIETALKEQVALSARTGSPVSVVMMDLDKFKYLNDKWGHGAGDAVLQAFGGVLNIHMPRTTDKAGRWGGEEFFIVLPATTEEGAKTIAEKIRLAMPDEIAQAVKDGPGYEFDRSITASMGIATFNPEQGQQINIEEVAKELSDTADRRLYLAKGNGRNRVVGTAEEQELSRAA